MSLHIPPAEVESIVEDIVRDLWDVQGELTAAVADSRALAVEAARLTQIRTGGTAWLFDATYKDIGNLSDSMMRLDDQFDRMIHAIRALRYNIWSTIDQYKYEVTILLNNYATTFKFIAAKNANGWAVWSLQSPYGQIAVNTITDGVLRCYMNFNAVETIDIGNASPDGVPQHDLSFTLHILPAADTHIQIVCRDVVYVCPTGTFKGAEGACSARRVV